MRKLIVLLLALFAVGGWVAFAAAVHVVRTPGRIILVPKDRLNPNLLEGTYIDTRQWTLADATVNAGLIRRLAAMGKLDRLVHVAAVADLTALVEGKRVGDGPRAATATSPARGATRDRSR